jgi:hypothetical protein
MVSKPQRRKERDGVLSTLDAVIQVLSLAKDTCGVLPAQIAFGSASVLLTMIRVNHPILSNELPVYFPSGLHDQQAGLRQSWAFLCRCLQSSRAGLGGEAIRRTQQVRARGD